MKCLETYTCIAERFEFLKKLKNLPADQISLPTDLKTSLSDELLHFSAFLNTEFAERSLDLTTVALPHLLLLSFFQYQVLWKQV